ncbi:MAG: glycosyltransferase family 9 protein [Saprospiraceae bacterium]|nr:glycosyltransferase family 9 protein [Saprospiraceae bacterium]
MKVLVVRFSSIGDIVLTTPVVRALYRQLGAEVHYLCKRSYARVIEGNPYVYRIHNIDKRVGEVLPALREEAFDAVIDLHNNLRSWQLRLGLMRKTYAFDKINLRKWLMVRFKIDLLPDLHIVDRYLDAARPLGIRKDGEGLDYFISSQDEVALPALFPEAAEGWTSGFVAFVVGAAHHTKRLPEEKVISLCRQMKKPVVLLGGPSDAEEGSRIADLAGNGVYNACGKLRLDQSASVIRQAEVVITPDTGLMHIAAAFQKRIISVWGNTIPEFGMYPYLPASAPQPKIIQVNGLSCRPCSKIGYEACPLDHFRCMRDIPEHELLQAVES